jgi:dihydroorotate dehydrogenase (NAD+) catalytic subunit
MSDLADLGYSDLGYSGPVAVAAGCGGTGRELAAYVDLASLGAFVTRSITVQARQAPVSLGAQAPVVESPSGLVFGLGCPNPGIDAFLALELPWLIQSGARVHVSLVGRSLGEYSELARRVGRTPGVAGVEVNLSDPDMTGHGLFDVREPFHAASAVAAVVRDLPRGVPVLAKLRTDVLRVTEVARAALEAGASGVVLGRALPAALPDGRGAGLSGPAIFPLMLRCLADAAVALPEALLVACGGLGTPADVRMALDAGAAAVQIGTAVLHDPTTPARLTRELIPGGPA